MLVWVCRMWVSGVCVGVLGVCLWVRVSGVWVWEL